MQTAMVAAALASHCRRAPDMGILDAPAFAQVPIEAVCRSGFTAVSCPSSDKTTMCHL